MSKYNISHKSFYGKIIKFCWTMFNEDLNKYFVLDKILNIIQI